MRPRRALVTGGAGFIGGHLVETLVADGWHVRVLDDFSSGREANLEAVRGRIDLVRGDVCDAEAVAKAVSGVGVVFHQAAVASVPRSIAEPCATHSVNVIGTIRVLEAARQAGVGRVVYAASTSVYGDGPELPKVEAMPVAPRSPYALQKHVGELYCRLWSGLHGLEVVALRYFNVYGPRQASTSEYAAVIPRFVRACLDGTTPQVYGDGRQTRDFVYVEDVVEANRLAAVVPLPTRFAACNVASGRPTNLLELLETIETLTGRAMTPEHRPPRTGDVRHSYASLDLATELLGYVPRVPLEEGLARTIAHFEGERGSP